MKVASIVTLALLTLNAPSAYAESQKPKLETVTPKTFIRAETDRVFRGLAQQAGGVNKIYHYREFTPLDKQTVIRMNKDTLYSVAVIDTKDDPWIEIPRVPDNRFVSVAFADNDMYVPVVLYASGKRTIPSTTRYMALGIRIQIFDLTDKKELEMVHKLQDQFKIHATSNEPLPTFKWDSKSLTKLRNQDEKESVKYKTWAGMSGPKGTVDEKNRHIAVAAVWGLNPDWDATYLNYSPNLDGKGCYKASYTVPSNKAFWSMTLYGSDGYMKSNNNIINASHVKMDGKDTFTAYFGSKEACGDVPNRLDVSKGWNILMRVYLPGEEVLNGTYKLPEVERVK